MSVEWVLAILGFAVITGPDELELFNLVTWNTVALITLIVGGVAVRRSLDREPDGPMPGRGQDFRVVGLLRAVIPVLVSLIGMIAAVSVVFDSGENGDESLVTQAIGVLTMIQAWLILHATYALRYAWWYARLGNRGLLFPQTRFPQLVDFLYFSFTLGTSFATSDVDVTDRRVRWQVMVHTVLGFFYNAVVLAVAFKLLTGS